MKHLIPACEPLVRTVLDSSTHAESVFHGEHHWQCVVRTGYQPIGSVPGADPAVVFLFGLLHDCQRLSDGWDPDHGPRAAEFAELLQGRLFHLSEPQFQRLQEACRLHTGGELTEDPTLGVCWDADRLNLWRVGIKPDPAYLSTAPARRRSTIDWARELQDRRLAWDELYQAFATLTSD